MTKSKEQLLNIWFNVWPVNSWLRILEMSGDYDQEDLMMFEQIDENAIVYEKEAMNDYWEKEVPKIKGQLSQFKEEFPADFIKEKRLEFLNSRTEALDKEIQSIWQDFQEATERDIPYWFRAAIKELRDPLELEKKLRSLTIEKHLLEHPEDLKKVDRVTPEEIARALDFPFGQLVQFNQAGFALCMFHNEKTPSFHWIKKSNRAYCHGCKWSGDTIQFLMDRDNADFRTAVRSLL